ncbi:MAG: transporter substrate-binding domain-containing protein, partial [Firmicutes bacterium]|nr:transporter substrate-binding domain-containing protein [Bacillota bacterium]
MGNTVSRGSLVRVMILATVFALALSLPALANDSLLDTIQRKGKMIVGIQTSAPPASMVNAKGQVEGFEVDVAKAIGRRLGVSVEFKQLTDATRIPSVQQGATDIVIATMTHTRERDKVV